MINTLIVRRDVLQSLGYSLAFAAIWAVAAALRPELTFHLAPLIVAGVAPVVLALGERHGAVQSRAVTVAAALGMGIAVASAAAISAAGWMTGPSLLPTGGAALEAIWFVFGGGVAGWLTGMGILRLSG